MVNYIKAIPEGQLREEIKKEAIEMIEKPQKIVYDEIELKVEKEMKEKILQSKLKRAEKIVKALDSKEGEDVDSD